MDQGDVIGLEAVGQHANDLAQPREQQRVAPDLAGGLGRIVTDQPRGDPFPASDPAADLGNGGHVPDGLLIGLHVGRAGLGQGGGAQARVLFGSGRRQEGTGRPDDLAVPVAIEVGRDVAGDGSDADDVQVGERHFTSGIEVFVADVASPHDGDQAVGGQ